MTVKTTDIYIDGVVMSFKWRSQVEYDLGTALLEKLTGGKQINATNETDFFIWSAASR